MALDCLFAVLHPPPPHTHTPFPLVSDLPTWSCLLQLHHCKWLIWGPNPEPHSIGLSIQAAHCPLTSLPGPATTSFSSSVAILRDRRPACCLCTCDNLLADRWRLAGRLQAQLLERKLSLLCLKMAVEVEDEEEEATRPGKEAKGGGGRGWRVGCEVWSV